MSSVFDAPTTEQEQANQGDTENSPTTDDWVSEVVKDKGEQWQDPQVIAKGYFHAQKRIKELESLEEKLKEQDYAKTLLEQLQAKQQQAPEGTTPPTPPEASTNDQSSSEQKDVTSLSPEDIESLLESKLSAREKEKKVEAGLREKFGADANLVVHRRAKELGLSIDRMKALATESPEAFLRLVGEPEPKETNSSVRSQVNTSASGFNKGSGERNAAYYSKLRRENRKLYDQQQGQMLQDRVRLGDAFYK